ncbi:hypothetical protein M514_08697 [Trichuris suis]|uniref:Peptidase A2 domain-containing protein n=1 Tax=Trichuris suis TaxID=68888 RepID=A0A085MYR0_9BILA|nr:hypothetical protein M513_08697 [Trichuris suis]KFD62356.1 hypothetical protein M514_08697 [Trichuris suis]
MKVDEVQRRALVDTGSTRCIAYAPCGKSWRKQQIHVTTVSGGQLQCIGMGSVKLQLLQGGQVPVEAVIADKKPLGFDFIIGINGISPPGDVMVNAQGQVHFGTEGDIVVASADAGINVEEKDFVAAYEPTTSTWTTAGE